jgi:hypothetical protein
MSASQEFCFFDLFDSIVNSSASTAEKLIALIIGRHIGREGQAAFPSRVRVIQQASCSLPTFKRAQPVLGAFFEIQERRGKTTLYSPKSISVEEVEEAVLSLRKRSARAPAHDDTGYQDDATSRDQFDTGVGIRMTPQKESLKKPSKIQGKKESSLRSDSAQLPLADCAPAPDDESDNQPNDPRWKVWNRCVPWLIEHSGQNERSIKNLTGRWLKKMPPAALLKVVRSAAERRHRGKDLIAYISGAVERSVASATRSDDGRLEVVNGFRGELEQLLGGRDLRRSLDLISGFIPQHIVGQDLEARVRSEVIKMVDMEQSRERRFAGQAGDRGLTGAAKYKKLYEGVL